MAETSALYFKRFSPIPSVSRSRDSNSFLSTSPLSFPFPSKFSKSFSRSYRSLHFTSKASDSGNFLGDDFLGSFPWSDGDNAIEWIQEEKVTLFTADGLIQIGGSVVPRLVSSSDKKQGRSNTTQRFQRYQESDYMDPQQGLCLGALFDIAATNVSHAFAVILEETVWILLRYLMYGIWSFQGLDTGRRLCIFGFCRSIEMLSDVVEDTVLEHGGEIVAAEKAIKGGLHEKLTMTVAVPYLWGVPPASETLRLAVRSGGGIVEKVYWQWDFL
ncbi:hypothetical protein JCGZ_16554 [Jatropha curcas]|uniref:DUF7811 domain-containing protein n=1 Tax=Jatropha curcas TaxID=180498 RepID=A0A067KA54_JATCU|nr:uncharacterized protein LOC105642265 isoform X1 [Jatropha curcas]KDP29165.1 hypothetical protein JCGZ_16554 [Jatropha curcas]